MRIMRGSRERGLGRGGGPNPPGKNSNLLKRKLDPLLTNTIIIIPWTSLPFLNFFFLDPHMSILVNVDVNWGSPNTA